MPYIYSVCLIVPGEGGRKQQASSFLNVECCTSKLFLTTALALREYNPCSFAQTDTLPHLPVTIHPMHWESEAKKKAVCVREMEREKERKESEWDKERVGVCFRELTTAYTARCVIQNFICFFHILPDGGNAFCPRLSGHGKDTERRPRLKKERQIKGRPLYSISN